MNVRHFFLTTSAIFLFALLWNGLVHTILLHEANRALEAFARPVAERNPVLSLLLTLGIAILFVYSYAAFVRTGGMKRALLHGAFFGLLAGLLVDLNQFILYPIPASLALGWFLFGFAEFLIYGVFAAWLYPLSARSSVSRQTI